MAYEDRINQYLREPSPKTHLMVADAFYGAAKSWFNRNYPEAAPEQCQSFCTKAAAKLGIA